MSESLPPYSYNRITYRVHNTRRPANEGRVNCTFNPPACYHVSCCSKAATQSAKHRLVLFQGWWAPGRVGAVCCGSPCCTNQAATDSRFRHRSASSCCTQSDSDSTRRARPSQNPSTLLPSASALDEHLYKIANSAKPGFFWCFHRRLSATQPSIGGPRLSPAGAFRYRFRFRIPIAIRTPHAAFGLTLAAAESPSIESICR